MERLREFSQLIFEYRIGFALAFIGTNLLSFILFALDKARSRRGEWRIRERTLLVSAIFGAFGAFSGMILLRHKTKHDGFIVGVFLLLALQTLFIAAIFLSAMI